MEVVMFLFLRLCCAALSAFIFVLFMPDLGLPLYRLSPYSNCYTEYCLEQWYWYESLGFKIKVIIAVLWVVLWALLEIRSFRRYTRPAPKLLTHLRYGPMAVLVFSLAAILASDFVLIQYSRWRIIQYIHS